MSLSCPFSLENAFGPVVNKCRRPFDFTLLFEQTILSILPNSIFILLAAIRIWQLWGKRRRISGRVLTFSKQCIILARLACCVAIIALWARPSNDGFEAALPSSALALVSLAFLAPLSWLEDQKIIRPSPLLCTYLLLITLLDLAQVRTLWLTGLDRSIAALFTTAFALGVMLLCIESVSKSRRLMVKSDTARSIEDKAGVISRSLFLWLLPLIYHGSRHTIEDTDLYPVPTGTEPEVIEQKLNEAWSKSFLNSRHRLILVTAHAAKIRLLSPIIPRLCFVGFTILQPILLSALLRFVEDRPRSANDGYGLLGAYALVYLGVAVSKAWYYHESFKCICAVRAGLVSMVYDTTLGLKASNSDNSSAITIMSADIERIVLGLKQIHEIWANVVQVALASWLLERQVGVGIVAPLVITALCAYATVKLSEAAGSQQARWLTKIEERINVTTSTLSSIRGVKLSGLVDKMMNAIQGLRDVELREAGRYRRWEIGTLLVGFFPVTITPVITFAIYIAAENARKQPLNAERLFVSLSYLTLMSAPLSMLFQAGPEITSMITCFDRIDKFLQSERRLDSRSCRTSSLSVASEKAVDHMSRSVNPPAAVEVKDGHFAWDEDAKPVLRNINLSVPSGALTMIVGPVGCGKSTLLKAILGEVTSARGLVRVSSDSVAFCESSPWIRNGTLKENIVMFSDEDHELYTATVGACALYEDLRRIPLGDEAKVGSSGVTLSGGQKQRISLARALYARRDINLFDDVLSGLDPATQNRIFADVFEISGILRHRGATVVLATHAVQFLPRADHIICIGGSGEIEQQGTFAELSSQPGYIDQLKISAAQEFSGSTDVLEVPNEKEMISKVAEDTVGTSGINSPGGVYRFYITAIGRWPALIYVLLGTIYAFLYVFPYIWVKWWSDEDAAHPGRRQGYYLGIYALLQVMCLIFLIALGWHAVITTITSSGSALHRSLISTALHAPLSFFEKTDQGSTLNRFSQDMQMIDNELPLAALNVVCNGLIVLGQLLLIMNTAYWLAISFPAIFAVLWLLQKIYLRTSRQLRHLELESKSPLYSLFVESLGSLATIRAFGWTEKLKALNYERLDKSQRPFYLLLCVQKWLTLVVDCMVTGFVLLLIGLIIALRHRVSAGFAGVALSNIVSIGLMLTSLLEVWTELETSVTSVQRIRDFERDTPSEFPSLKPQDFPVSWPDEGAVRINNLSATYRDGATVALHGITIDIRPGEKLGICGRTGSGKTSLMLALFGMIDVREGNITIDGVDLSSIHPDRVRDSLNAIPQDPYFVAGTVRTNADPHGRRTDEEIIDALKSVHLDKLIRQEEGLEAKITDGTLSHGEQQLFCLARAMLKQGKVVVLDEATSNIDVITGKIIQEVIAKHFQDSTVITIAHRLDTILSSDRIALLDGGILVELDKPDVLLARQSRFKTLWDANKLE